MDVAVFQPINSKALQTEGHADIAAAVQGALDLVRKHSDVLSAFVAHRLSDTLSVTTAQFNFTFKNHEAAAEAIRVSLQQTADEPRARGMALSVANLLMHDLQYPSLYSKGNDHLFATLTVAHSAHAWLLYVASRVTPDITRISLQAKGATASWIHKFALVAVGFLIAWLVLK